MMKGDIGQYAGAGNITAQGRYALYQRMGMYSMVSVQVSVQIMKFMYWESDHHLPDPFPSTL
jgi:hypothetical protein